MKMNHRTARVLYPSVRVVGQLMLLHGFCLVFQHLFLVVMDSNSREDFDSKAEFRKPSNDAANRKYRHRSPIGGSSPSSDVKRMKAAMDQTNLELLAESLSEEEIAGLKEMFKAMDTDNSGSITFDEIKAGLKKYGSTLRDTVIQDLMDAILIFPMPDKIGCIED